MPSKSKSFIIYQSEFVIRNWEERISRADASLIHAGVTKFNSVFFGIRAMVDKNIEI